MEKEINEQITFLLNRLSIEFPQISKALTREAKKRQMSVDDRKVYKLRLLKAQHPGVIEGLFDALNQHFGYREEGSGIKTNTFFNSPYIMTRVNADPLEF